MSLEVSTRCIYNSKARRRLCSPTGDVVVICVLAEILLWMMILSIAHPVVWSLALTCAGLHAIGINVFAQKRLRQWREFSSLLQPQLEDRYGVSLAHAACFGIAPGRGTEQFLGDRIWDIGFVEARERLRFYGDQSIFSLDRSVIKRVRCRNGMHPHLEIEYLGAAGKLESLTLEYRRGAARSERLLEALRLKTQIALMPAESVGSPTRFPFVARELAV
jgi:hypothetical protein